MVEAKTRSPVQGLVVQILFTSLKGLNSAPVMAEQDFAISHIACLCGCKNENR